MKMKFKTNAAFSFILVLICLCLVQCKTSNTIDNASVTAIDGKEHGLISTQDVLRFKTNGSVSYSDFGATGDGKTDDMNAIVATHAYANEHELEVKANSEATYYIGGKPLTAIIRTDVDFSTASFIIDDTALEDKSSSVFMVSSDKELFEVEGIHSLKKNQERLNVSLPGSCLITVTNDHIKHYIRYGLNQNNGSPQTDIFMVDKNGKVDAQTPIIWDFDQITEMNALPIDEDTLRISGGRFVTMANQAESKYNYHSRNILIKRSHVIVDGLEHRITGEGDHGAPYRGFISIHDCAYVTVKNTVLTGHKTYRTIGRAGKPVSMGSYDLSVGRALNVSFINCTQTNDIDDREFWGILGSNYCKNLLYEQCVLSRFDAHKGVYNATIRNSTLGHMGINAIGSGTFTLENSTVRGRNLINLRSDYGSTWQGEMIIRDCVFAPQGKNSGKAKLISGSYSSQHDFGYTCYMPERIMIENLHIDDSNQTEDYKGLAVFANFNSEMTDESYHEEFPYVKTKELVLKNITTTSGKALRLSDNEFMFKDVKVYVE